MTNSIPKLPPTIVSKLSSFSDEWAKRAPSGIDQLNVLARHLPEKYGWRFRNAEVFNREVRAISKSSPEPLEINRFYWRDLLGTVEAFSLMSAWRGVDLARGFVRMVTVDDIACAGIIARAALENTVFYIDAVRTICATVGGSSNVPGGILDPSIDFSKQVSLSLDLEKFLLKTVFANRLPHADEMYSPTNILTIMKRLSKTPTQETLFARYELLCEVSHPNFLGKSIYLLDQDIKSGLGDEVRTIGLGAGPASVQVLEAALSAISWSCAGIVSGFSLQVQTTQAALARLGIGPTGTTH